MAKQERDDVHSAALLAKLCIAEENLSKTVNVFSKGPPSRMRMVLRISLGITTRPRSSMRRTIPVAFIYKTPPVKQILTALIIRSFCLDMQFLPLYKRERAVVKYPDTA